ncbi:MAG: SPASM domain-containing protein [bacterium]|nr:MAG: SPASM domain-containing protein [bacterium]
MNRMRFDMPWRINWRLGEGTSEELVDAVRRCRPLSVTVQVSGAHHLGALKLPWEGVSVTAVLEEWSLGAGSLPTEGISRWEFTLAEPGQADEVVAGSFLGVPAHRASHSWSPLRGQIRHLPGLLEAAARAGCGLTLPNRPAGVITTLGADAFPDPGELDHMTVELIRRQAGLVQPQCLRVHDFILARALGLEGTEPQGCEAANAIAYIDAEGTVYPCESLMVPLGSLKEDDPEAIFRSPVRERIRRDVEGLPGLCVPCPELTACVGGCRGAVYHLTGHYAAPDPSCPGRAEEHHG